VTRLDSEHGQPHGAPPPVSATRKKRQWPWIVCGILGALVVLGAIANAVDPSPKPGAGSRESGTAGCPVISGSPFTNSPAHCCSSVRTRAIRVA
jgi:hypothetical protein